MLAAVAESPQVQQPAAHLLALALVTICWQLRSRCLGYTAVGVSYDAVVRRGEWWRCVTATFTHVDLLHLTLNCFSVLAYGTIEEQHGTAYFLHVTALLCHRYRQPFAGTARKLGGGGSSMRRIGGVPLRKGSASPAQAAADAGATASPAKPPGSPAYRILRFSPEAPPTA